MLPHYWPQRYIRVDASMQCPAYDGFHILMTLSRAITCRQLAAFTPPGFQEYTRRCSFRRCCRLAFNSTSRVTLIDRPCAASKGFHVAFTLSASQCTGKNGTIISKWPVWGSSHADCFTHHVVPLMPRAFLLIIATASSMRTS